MTTKLQQLTQNILSSQGKLEADFILKNAQVADVYTLTWRKADIVVKNGTIVALDHSNRFHAKEVEDAAGSYVIPGLIDGHIHIESSMLTPGEFSRVLIPHGITTVITDPHEIANVAGAEGIQFMLDDAQKADMDIFVMLPSSVPGTQFENAGATLTAQDLEPFLHHEQVRGLAEVMDFPAVLNGEEGMLQKILLSKEANLVIDGHCAGLQSEQITGYRAAGIQTDHECVTAEEAIDRVEQGMYVLIREGSAAKNLRDLLPAIQSHNARRFGFCTDDKYVDELMDEGSINYDVAMAIAEGMTPLQAIQLATVNTAECYRLFDRGVLAPGYKADFVLVDDLSTMQAKAVWKNGHKVAENGEMLTSRQEAKVPAHIHHSVHLPSMTKDSLQLSFKKGTRANVMEIVPNQLITNHLVIDVPVKEGVFVPSIEQDLLKLAVIERHHHLHTTGLGIVKGFGLQKGAVATTVAHDSHNALVVGTNDEDMILALSRIQEIQGGFVIVADGEILAEMPLTIGGLMTDVPAQQAKEQLAGLHNALQKLNPTLDFHFLLTFSFVALPVIPALKLTDTGLFDVTTFQHIEVEA
ncbi:adenine deaminase [Lysinibacillus sphaericus]|uniref:Adenine deaminase n=3 Tax=Lysinibacillus TaxID=400634 RepID=ADEC_LYSSC|nr:MULTISPECIES: adenine deaminase [Lysinibacillus]B1HR71.1 RecName: Full=Adenine deaminase; Short=Adenase; Short=Adenine aminase [Lysinibacillus sphaericus C3-41]MBE5084041.1 adenine deaminase [Bacillus thuringiensis]ACA40851.1 Adenine deaminase [Lysinibacillus sphaericus C3-41]AMO33188.1 adenine deaminase [Lysinibacillus sphaericus]AMR91709.1 adenine deaminase [Lysinibacillus sphaericus]ANA45756.1 adenine deaminase [Lysinibacillus sphaericus]